MHGGTDRPCVKVKIVKQQWSADKKKELIEGLTDLIVNIMGRERNYTVITVDELNEDQWAIGGITLDRMQEDGKSVSFINIKVSEGTTNADEMADMIWATEELMVHIMDNSEETNYVILDELNPAGWGVDGLSMTERRKLLS